MRMFFFRLESTEADVITRKFKLHQRVYIYIFCKGVVRQVSYYSKAKEEEKENLTKRKQSERKVCQKKLLMKRERTKKRDPLSL